MFNIPVVSLKHSPAVEAVVDETSLKRFTFQPPIPLLLDGRSEMEASHKAQITLDEKVQPLKEPFRFRPPIPIALESTSALEDSHTDRIIQDEKAPPPEEPFSFQSPILIPVCGILAMEDYHKARTTLNGNEQPLDQRFSFQSPIPIPLAGSSALEASDNTRFNLNGNGQPLEQRFSFQSPLPIPSAISLVLDATDITRIPLDEEEQLLEEPFSFQASTSLLSEDSSPMETSENAPINLEAKEQSLKDCFSFQPPISIPIPIPLDSGSAMNVSHNAGITVDKKRQPLKELFSFQSPIPVPNPLDGRSPMKTPHNDEINLDDKGQALKKRFIYQSPIPMPFAGSSAMKASQKALITLYGTDQFLEELFSFQSPTPIPLEDSSSIKASKDARIVLEEKGQALKDRFSFQSPIPIPVPLDSGSAMNVSHNAGITVDEKGQPLKEQFSFQSPIPIPIPSASSSGLEALDEKRKALEKHFNFQPLPSSGLLALNALLADNRLFEAFHQARITLDAEGQNLVEHFFHHCIENHRFKVLTDLCLNEEEEQMLHRLLLQCGSRQAETVQLILQLQNNKYIKAVNFKEYVFAEGKRSDDVLDRLLSSYRSQMSPVTRDVAESYLQIQCRLGMGLADVPNVEGSRPLSCQLASQNPSDTQSSVFSTLLAENPENPNNVPFLRTQQYGSSEMPQRLRMMRPVSYRSMRKRQSVLKDSHEEPSNKRFRFQPPISLHFDGSMPMQSGGQDAAKKNEGPETKVENIEAAAKEKVSPPLKASSVDPQSSGVRRQDSPMDRRMRLRASASKEASSITTPQRRVLKYKPLLEVIEEEAFLNIRRSCPRFRSDPKTVPSVPSESKQSRLGRTARRQSSQLNNDMNSNQNREFHPRRDPTLTEPDSRPASRSSERASRSLAPTEGRSEAHVPPINRGRPKKQLGLSCITT